MRRIFVTNRRQFLIHLGTSIAASNFALRSAFAQNAVFPTKPVKVIVPFPAGGAIDATIRLIAPSLAADLGQPIVIENKPGANGALGASAVAVAEADGHTLLLAPREVFGINPVLSKSLSYDPVNGFEAIGIVANGPYVLVANPALGIRSMKDLVALAATRDLNYASFGVGSMGHFNIEAFARAAKIRLTHVPFRGSAQAVQAVISGDAAIAISTAPAALGLIQDGKLTALAAGSPQRLALLPDVPTLAETGIAGDTLIPAFFAMAAPKATPQPAVERVATAVRRALSEPAVTDGLQRLGLTAGPVDADHMRKAVASDIDRFRALASAIGIKSE